MRSRRSYAADEFSVIYVEEEVLSCLRTKEILAKFTYATIIPIRRYSDVFDRTRQTFSLQRDSRALILACKHGQHIYKGAPVCQNFNEERFYYCCTAMNCIYDCSYCWLKGMYAGGHVVIFVNLDDFFYETEELLKQDDLYMCVAYESDIVALEGIAGQTKAWHDFTLSHPGLTVEVRTKCANPRVWEELDPCDRFIAAFTLSPQPVIESMEQGTPSLAARLAVVNKCLVKGHPVRLCFDPLLYMEDAENIYEDMIEEVMREVDLSKVRDISIGTFRMSASYMKNMRKRFPVDAVVQYPYVTDKGYCHYPKEIIEKMEDIVRKKLETVVPAEKIFEEADYE